MTELEHSPSQIMAQLLIDDDFGSHPEEDPQREWPIFYSHIPDEPDSVICVYDTEGTETGRRMHGPFVDHPGLQIRIRGKVYHETYAKANQVETKLDQIVRQTVVLKNKAGEDVTYKVQAVSRTSGVIPLVGPTDDKKRTSFTLNATLTLRQQP